MNRDTFSWALYDWGNSAYATAVMAGFFPVFFKEYWSAGTETTTSSFYLGIANSAASLIIVLLAPLLGAIADRWSARKRFLLIFAFLGVVMTALLPLVAKGEWQYAVLLYVIATLGFSGSVSFYDSLLVYVSESDQYDKVSAYGYALGYLGGGLLFAFCVWMTLAPETFGLADAAEAVKTSFILVALWWALFTIPLWLYVKEPDEGAAGNLSIAVAEGIRQLIQTFGEIRELKVVLTFLVAYWCYIDGVDTIVRMAVDYGLSLGFKSESLITALLITQFVGFPAAIVFGRLGESLGPKSGIYIAIVVYIGVVIAAYFMDSELEFYIIAVVIGLVQGGIQSLSRSLYVRLIPAEKSAEFFGFYNMLGKFAAVLGPIMMGWSAAATGSTRASILSLLILFILGALFLSKVDIGEGQQRAEHL